MAIAPEGARPARGRAAVIREDDAGASLATSARTRSNLATGPGP